MRIKAQIDHAVIVLVGRFNPAIFQPAWFALHKMLGGKEAETAELKVIMGEASQFKVDQFEILVLPERFTITSLDAHPEHIRDLVVSCFRGVLTAYAGTGDGNKSLRPLRYWRFRGKRSRRKPVGSEGCMGQLVKRNRGSVT